MKIKIPTKKLLILIGLIISLPFFFYFTTKQETILQVGLPMRLEIKSIGVDSLIEYVSTTTKGEMDTPKLLEDVAWFSPGTYPGEVGTAVIAGHSGWINYKTAVFDRLSKIKVGDIVTIKNDNGVNTNFVVSNLKKYNSLGDPTEVFTSNDGKSHLNLITCSGIWDTENKNYKERLVVFTDKEIKN